MNGSRYYTDVAAVFADVAAEWRERAAIQWSTDTATTYDELDRLSNQIARALLDRGVGKRDTVCIAIDKCPMAYGMMLGCLKIGAVYFAIDPANPAARIRAIVEQCKPSLALIAAAEQAGLFDCDTVQLDEGVFPAWLSGIGAEPIQRPWPIDGSDPAYVMFTSGSTGVPKGVTISHANLLNFIRWTQSAYDTRVTDVFTGLNPLFFDNSVFDFYASLFAGASLVPFTSRMMQEPGEVTHRIEQLGCTLYFSVPSLIVYFQRLKLITAASFPSLRAMIFGGEGYPKPMLARLHAAIGTRVALHNVYGPTECTCICSSYQVTAEDLADPVGYSPLGRLAPNFSGVIIGEAGGPVADGEIGELYLGGPCVGLGYYGQPEQSARVFVQHPLHNRFFERIYRTGDLVRLDPADGKLYFAGRADAQIKRQGYRIELGEIEHALASHEAVEEAAVVYLDDTSVGRLVGIVASTKPDLTAALKEHLAAALPKYMIPDRIAVVRQLPKTANGKIDRKAIAEAIRTDTL